MPAYSEKVKLLVVAKEFPRNDEASRTFKKSKEDLAAASLGVMEK